MSERRVAARFTMKPMPATFEAEEIRGRGHVLNLGASGLFLDTESPPKPGARVRVVFENTAGNEIEVEGTVRWSLGDVEGGSPGFGMVIEEPSPGYRGFYEQLLGLHEEMLGTERPS